MSIRAEHCRSCGAEIFWARHMHTGRWMPVDLAPAPEGNVLPSVTPGEVLALVLPHGEEPPPDTPRYVSHFVTCPNADQHRKARR